MFGNASYGSIAYGSIFIDANVIEITTTSGQPATILLTRRAASPLLTRGARTTLFSRTIPPASLGSSRIPTATVLTSRRPVTVL